MSPSWSLESLAGSCRPCFPRALQPCPGLRVGGMDLHGAAWRPQEDALCDWERVPSQRLPHAPHGLLPSDRLSVGSGDSVSLSQILSETLSHGPRSQRQQQGLCLQACRGPPPPRWLPCFPQTGRNHAQASPSRGTGWGPQWILRGQRALCGPTPCPHCSG